MTDDEFGWDWLMENQAAGGPGDGEGPSQDDICRSAARCLSGPDGARVVSHLRALTRDRILGPHCSDAVMRHLEGQRFIVAYLDSLVE